MTARFLPAPADSAFDLRLVAAPPEGRPRLEFQGVPGAAYTLERSEDMRQWSAETAFFADADGRWGFLPPSPAPTGQSLTATYYRVTTP